MAQLSGKLIEKLIECAAVLPPGESIVRLPDYPEVTAENGWFFYGSLTGELGNVLGEVTLMANDGFLEPCPCLCGNVFRIKSKYRKEVTRGG